MQMREIGWSTSTVYCERVRRLSHPHADPQSIHPPILCTHTQTSTGPDGRRSELDLGCWNEDGGMSFEWEI